MRIEQFLCLVAWSVRNFLCYNLEVEGIYKNINVFDSECWTDDDSIASNTLLNALINVFWLILNLFILFFSLFHASEKIPKNKKIILLILIFKLILLSCTQNKIIFLKSQIKKKKQFEIPVKKLLNIATKREFLWMFGQWTHTLRLLLLYFFKTGKWWEHQCAVPSTRVWRTNIVFIPWEGILWEEESSYKSRLGRMVWPFFIGCCWI